MLMASASPRTEGRDWFRKVRRPNSAYQVGTALAEAIVEPSNDNPTERAIGEGPESADQAPGEARAIA